jgi:hypothetical protein
MENGQCSPMYFHWCVNMYIHTCSMYIYTYVCAYSTVHIPVVCTYVCMHVHIHSLFYGQPNELCIALCVIMWCRGLAICLLLWHTYVRTYISTYVCTQSHVNLVAMILVWWCRTNHQNKEWTPLCWKWVFTNLYLPCSFVMEASLGVFPLLWLETHC